MAEQNQKGVDLNLERSKVIPSAYLVSSACHWLHPTRTHVIAGGWHCSPRIVQTREGYLMVEEVLEPRFPSHRSDGYWPR